MNSSGQTIPSTSVAPAGTRVFFSKAILVTLVYC